ncbi:MAG: hypothetical protein AAF367_08935 [Pseudomonadota bacterium]
MNAMGVFISENLWLTVGVGVLAVIILDEILGVSRGIFGDDGDDIDLPHKRTDDQAEAEPFDPVEDLQREEDTAEVIVDDLLTPTQPKDQ